MTDKKFVLYAEDDAHYAALMEVVFREAGFPHSVLTVPNGCEVINYLCGNGRYADRTFFPLPSLVMLDLKMPLMDGFETLSWIRSKSPNPHQPVVVLTCSGEMRDIQKAYELGANSFLIKPPNVEDLKGMMTTLETYWLRHNAVVPPIVKRVGASC